MYEYLKNPLFSEFCHWFLDESNKLFPFPERSETYDMLISYAAEKIDDVEVNLGEVMNKYPTIGTAFRKGEKKGMMFEKIFMKFRRIKHLGLHYTHLTYQIVRCITRLHLFETMSSLEIYDQDAPCPRKDIFKLIPEKSPFLFLHAWFDCSFHITLTCGLNKKASDVLDAMLMTNTCSKRSVYLEAKYFLYHPVSERACQSVDILDLSNAFMCLTKFCINITAISTICQFTLN